MGADEILYERRHGVARITLNRPAALNALTPTMLAELAEMLDAVVQDDAVRAVLLTGAGRAFCSGADLAVAGGELGQAERDAGAALESHYNPLVEQLFALPLPVVTAVNGAAAGGGCSLALAGDLVVAARSAYFLQAFVHIGLTPDVGATWLLPRLIGRNRASAMMLLGDRVGAEQALSWGLAHQVFEDEELMPGAVALAERLARGPTKAYALIRQGIRSALELSLAETLALERRSQRSAGLTNDFEEGVGAFLQRRPPQFQGR